MKTILCIGLLLIGWVATAAAQAPTTRVVRAAEAFLSSLDEKQRQAVLFRYDDEPQRARWSNLPITIVRRAGLSFKEMTPAQREAGWALMTAALSPRGLEKVRQIVEGDQVLKEEGGRNNPMFGSDLYFFSILGTPSERDPWLLQFGGHHLALNITIAGDRGVLTPTLTAAQPARYVRNGKEVRPLGQESDQAVALLKSLDETQRKQAVLDYGVSDLVLGPGKDGQTIRPEGLKASAMNPAQRAMLVGIITEWAGIVQETAATQRLADLKADLDETWFAWSGSTDVTVGKNIASYYRIQGPRLVIEYSPQQMGGDPTMHVHSMYRDPTNDYGRAPVKK